MRALELQQIAGPDGLVVVDRPDPEAGDGVLLDVRAAGVAFPDLLVTQGRYQERPALPHVPGQEVAGIVRQAPPEADVRPGDRVWATVPAGGLASLAVAAVGDVHPLPADLSFPEGAALGVNFTTAVFALCVRDRVQAGEVVVVLGAAGGLGTALTSVAARLGAHVLAVVSDAAKAETARRAGAGQVLVGEGWREEVLARTGGRGADVVADVVGGPATLQAVRSCAPGGRVLVLGFTSGEIPAVAGNRLLLRNVSLTGVGLGAFAAADPTTMPAVVARLTSLLAQGLRPLVGRTYPLEDGIAALRALEARAAIGKLVLIP